MFNGHLLIWLELLLIVSIFDGTLTNNKQCIPHKWCDLLRDLNIKCCSEEVFSASNKKKIFNPMTRLAPMIIPIDTTTTDISNSYKEYNCGRQFMLNNNKIVGGSETKFGEFPWLALIFYAKYNRNECSGSVIQRNFILTAAHCLTSRIINSMGKPYKVRLGEYDVITDPDCLLNENLCAPNAVDIQILSSFPHPKYQTNSRSSYDIGLIKLTDDIVYNNFIQPICFDLDIELDRLEVTGQRFFISGWGKTENADNCKKTDRLLEHIFGIEWHEIQASAPTTVPTPIHAPIAIPGFQRVPSFQFSPAPLVTFCKSPGKQLITKADSRNITEDEKNSDSNQESKNDENHSKVHGFNKQIAVENHSQKPTRFPASIPIPISIPAPIHFGFKCNSCFGQIQGHRYKCTECPNFDLCSKCEIQDLHKEHQMLLIDDPKTETDYDPRFWKATLNKYEPKNRHEVESSNNQTSKYDEVQSKVQGSDSAKGQKTLENRSRKSASVLQPIEPSSSTTTKTAGGSYGIGEPSTMNYSAKYDDSGKSVMTVDYRCTPSATSNSIPLVVSAESTVAEIEEADAIESKLQDVSLFSSTKQNGPWNYPLSSNFTRFYDITEPFKFGTATTAANALKNKNKPSWNIIEKTKSTSNNAQPSIAGKFTDWDQGIDESTNFESNAAPESEFNTSFWKAKEAKTVHH